MTESSIIDLTEDTELLLPSPIPLRRNTKPKPDLIINYKSFMQDSSCIRKARISDLKQSLKRVKISIHSWNASIARHYDFMLSGNKSMLSSRLICFFTKTSHAINIQRIFRGFIVKLFIKLRNFENKDKDDRVVCINSTDFYSLEYVKDISYKTFFSYTDDKKFTYGFHIISLIYLYTRHDDFLNPYNRDVIPNHVLDKLIRIYNLTNIIFPGIIENFARLVKVPAIELNGSYRTSRVVTPIRNARNMRNTRNVRNTQNMSEALYNIEPELLTEIHERMERIRDRTLIDRVNTVFIQLNNSGNDVDVNWFLYLQKNDYYRLFNTMKDIWHFRLELPFQIKSMICPMGNPFEGSNFGISSYLETSVEEVRKSVIYAVENMIFSGVTDEYRQIGNLQFLTAFTSVSIPARQAISYLYESLH